MHLQMDYLNTRDVKLSDITIATSAAPTYLPAYGFPANEVEFNLIDGGVAANNPVSSSTIRTNSHVEEDN